MENFKELSLEEMQEIDGGFPWLLYAGYVAGVAALAVVTDVIVNWDEYVDVVNQAWEDGYKIGYNS